MSSGSIEHDIDARLAHEFMPSPSGGVDVAPSIADGTTRIASIAPWLAVDDSEVSSVPNMNVRDVFDSLGHMVISLVDCPQPAVPSKSVQIPFPSNSNDEYMAERNPSSSQFYPHGRISESSSFFDTASSINTAVASSAKSSLTAVSQLDLRRPKSSISILTAALKRSRSRTTLRSDAGHGYDGAPPMPSTESLASHSQVSFTHFPSPAPNGRQSKRTGGLKNLLGHAHSRDKHAPPTPPPKDYSFNNTKIDIGLSGGKGIVDLDLDKDIINTNGGHFEPSSAHSPVGTSNFDSSSNQSHTEHTSPESLFQITNPFLPSVQNTNHLRNDIYMDYKVSPKTIISPSTFPADWHAPDSWEILDKPDEQNERYSSSDESTANQPLSPSTTTISTARDIATKRRSRRRTRAHRIPPVDRMYQVRIYGANNVYHVAKMDLRTSVAQLIPYLNEKLLKPSEKKETHKLYLKERGRERVLANTEKPADIFRRRLEQAGYVISDDLDLQGTEDLTFLVKFVYKSQLLGPTEDLNFQSNVFEYVDLSSRSLRTIPVALHSHAEEIVTLTLSRNPMLEIPLDFIQACSTLRELRLSNMAMKRVPANVRHSETLQWLDVSCNRIVDLSDAGLDNILGLMTLKLQNNRIESLPPYFPRIRSLKQLNISNNKFKTFPEVVSQMTNLVDLDISFNMITELPSSIGQLKVLERFIIVGNHISRFPQECESMTMLKELDCRRNRIGDVSVVLTLPNLRMLMTDHNQLHQLDTNIGPALVTLDTSYNDITKLNMLLGPLGQQHQPFSLTTLNISHAKLSSIDDAALALLTGLETLKLDHNLFRTLPETLGSLYVLKTFSCAHNLLDRLPESIGRLQKLEVLDAHNNSLKELPTSLWNCASLITINMTSNLLCNWSDPPLQYRPLPPLPPPASDAGLQPWHGSLGGSSSGSSVGGASLLSSSPPLLLPPRKPSTAGSLSNGIYGNVILPPLAASLERLYLGENMFTDDVVHPLMYLKQLRVLNLSFNQIQDLPSNFLLEMGLLRELYLSGNKLTSFPMESSDPPKLEKSDKHEGEKLEPQKFDKFERIKLAVLFLNGNRLQTLPAELGKLRNLTVLDVGSNNLRYNTNNWRFDWNWNFNPSLKYLNLSGNKRLEIKPQGRQSESDRWRIGPLEEKLADFASLSQLRVLGLMDVTTTWLPNIPEENEDRRVRTSTSEVNKMKYGIADSLGKNEHLNMFDLVQPEFRERKDEAIFAMFGRAQAIASNNRLSKFLHSKFIPVFTEQLNALTPSMEDTCVPDALRRTFLRLNKLLHDELCLLSATNRKMSQVSATTVNTPGFDQQSILSAGASGIVLFFSGKRLFVANAGNCLAVVSRGGTAYAVSVKHDPWTEIDRIRAAEGWVSPKGTVNDEIDISRSFGFYPLVPVVNSRPDVRTWELSPNDEFVIVGNRGLWDYVDYQTAIDIARNDRADPMTAAQKLRDFAISYGADGSTMIMVISTSDLFSADMERKGTMESFVDIPRRRPREDISDRNIIRLQYEVRPPVNHVALVFTDIRNSTHLWEVNPGMPAAMRIHNAVLRRQLRFCGGYEVKTEGDAFMCSFSTALQAVWWSVTVQMQLLQEPWPLEILECEDGLERHDANGRVVARGLSVRMGIHCGYPSCEPDPVTGRMDYFGSMVNRASRISARADGGQIMCSADIIREICARVFDDGSRTEQSDMQPRQAIDALKELDLEVIHVGLAKLKGLEAPENLSMIYPKELSGRQELEPLDTNTTSASISRVQFNVEQMRDLGMLTLRLEALASARIFKPLPQRKPSSQPNELLEGPPPMEHSVFFYGNPTTLLPPMGDSSTDAELTTIMDSFAGRIENALLSLVRLQQMGPTDQHPSSLQVMDALQRHGALDERTLQSILNLLS